MAQVSTNDVDFQRVCAAGIDHQAKTLAGELAAEVLAGLVADGDVLETELRLSRRVEAPHHRNQRTGHGRLLPLIGKERYSSGPPAASSWNMPDALLQASRETATTFER